MRILKYESVAFNRRGRYLFGIIIFCSLFLFVGCINGSKKKKDNTTESSESTGNSETKPRAKFPIELDYTKNYPTKDIDLTEIADIEYVSFKDEGVLFDASAGHRGLAISDKYIILGNREGTVFVFDRGGKLINKFNKRGRSGKEYTYLVKLAVDFKNREILICDIVQKYKMLIYSFEGEFKRSFNIPQPLGTNTIVDYDDEYFLAHFEIFKGTVKKRKTDNIFYYFIEKSSGKFIPMNIAPKEGVTEWARILVRSGKHVSYTTFGLPAHPILKNGSDVFISDLGRDTIYNIDKGGQLTPFIVRTPSFINSDEPTLVYLLFRTNRYTYVGKVIRTNSVEKDNQYERFIVDNYTGEIFKMKLKFNDDSLNSYVLFAFGQNLLPNSIAMMHNTFRYVERNEKGELKGKLKEFVSTLKEDDNNFLMIMTFKE